MAAAANRFGGRGSSPVSGAQTGFHGLSLNHVTFRVSDIQKIEPLLPGSGGTSAYASKRSMARFLAMGTNHSLSWPRRKPLLGVDHFCIAIANFDQKEVVGRLKQEGLDPQVNVRGEIYVRDPDGLRVQVSAEDYAGQFALDPYASAAALCLHFRRSRILPRGCVMLAIHYRVSCLF